MFIDLILEFAKFLYAKNKALINAFSYVWSPTLPPSQEGFGARNKAKIHTFNEK